MYTTSYRCLLLAVCLTCLTTKLGAQAAGARAEKTGLGQPVVITQRSIDAAIQRQGKGHGRTLPADDSGAARIVVVSPDGSVRVLTGGFHSASDPDISFDGQRVLFAAKRLASDRWNVYEMAVDGSQVRQITRGWGNCRSPVYQATLYTIISTEPWYQLTFVSDAADVMNEDGSGPATHLYSCKLDGSAVRRLTYNLSSDRDPFLMGDGRLLFSSWQHSRLSHGPLGRVGLFGVNIDGTDFARHASTEGRRVKRMPCTTGQGLVVFVESDNPPWDAAGTLSCVNMRRPLHSYRPLTGETAGLCHSPSPLPDGTILVSRRPRDGTGTHALWRFDPEAGRWWRVFDDPNYHDMQAKVVCGRPQPDGRSSVVTEDDPHGKLYCLNVYQSDLKDRRWMPRGTVKRLRVLEGQPLARDPTPSPRSANDTSSSILNRRAVGAAPPLAQRRILGEIDVAEDGSFNIELPANMAVQLQTLDRDGMALRSCVWIWAKNHEPRGCIGCHEDGEATPENVFVDAARLPSIALTGPPARRRSIDFCRDVMPIIDRKCIPCHGPAGSPPRLVDPAAPVATAGVQARATLAYDRLLAVDSSGDHVNSTMRPGKYVHPGRARTSPLVWHLFGRNTSRPWDGAAAVGRAQAIPTNQAQALTDNERRLFVEWIDMGARCEATADSDNKRVSQATEGASP